MDLLQKIVLPQSAHHMELLRNLLVLTFLIFVPYVSVLLGSSLLSVFFKRRGFKNNNKVDLRFAKNLIDTVTITKSMSLAFGVLPLLSIVFCYAQLLSGTEVSAKLASYLIFGTLLFFVSLVLLYTYKYSFHIHDIMSSIKEPDEDSSIKEEIEIYRNSTSILFSKTGFWGLLTLVVSLFFILGAIQTAASSNSWNNISSFIDVVFSLKSLVYVILFMVLSLSVTSATSLFLNFRPNSKIVFNSDEEKTYFKQKLLYVGLFSTLVLPLLFVASVFVLSNETLNAELFAISAIVVLILLFVAVRYYLMIRDNKNLSSGLIFLYVVLFLFAILRDQMAFEQGTEYHFNKLAHEYEVYEKELKASMGLETETISGADIYNGRCIACHNFDKVLVGPAYNDVLVKYEGKMDDLVKFILNPVKVNPKFTVMPNQGLKPKEAEAVAEYIMGVYTSNKGK